MPMPPIDPPVPALATVRAAGNPDAYLAALRAATEGDLFALLRYDIARLGSGRRRLLSAALAHDPAAGQWIAPDSAPDEEAWAFLQMRAGLRLRDRVVALLAAVEAGRRLPPAMPVKVWLAVWGRDAAAPEGTPDGACGARVEAAVCAGLIDRVTFPAAARRLRVSGIAYFASADAEAPYGVGAFRPREVDPAPMTITVTDATPVPPSL